MFPSDALVHLSRAQFALTALFHFLFVPLTLGLTWILVVMEASYLKTGKEVYKDMTQFWGKLLAINFAMGVITGITLEFEFGQNWAYFSRMIGGSFGPILAIEGITAFMLEATMFGLFFFSWDKLSRGAHFCVTFLMAIGASLSIVNILAANSWMQHPIATTFNYTNMSLELSSLAALYSNHLAQIRIGHVAFAGFFIGSTFVMGISAFYLLRGRDIDFAKRSFAVGAGFGLICALSVAFFGDQNGLEVARYEPEKMAAIEAQWDTQPPPAAWYLIAFPSTKDHKNYFTLAIPYALSLIATHSLSGTVEGMDQIVQTYQGRIQNGMKSYAALQKLLRKQATPEIVATYNQFENDLGFGFLLKYFTPNVVDATPAQITATAWQAIPSVPTAFWTFRFMLGFWLLVTLLMILGVIFVLRNSLTKHPFYLRCMLYSISLPFMAAECGWVLAETGRQPWVVHYFLPTYMGVSTLPTGALVTSISGFAIFYVGLFCVELFLMFKYARLGPSALGKKRYYFETNDGR
ncbi:MAG: cytochrome d terminal oxidase subunit 1 [Coxiella sp. RIFCSPHIGHO2_12_FULL_42_15]|nr:MAG: cytochrome d terminal oxidase subunit 1 [Coxiella sp. RIFCSPHIGHO2_12_FULL_42_15]